MEGGTGKKPTCEQGRTPLLIFATRPPTPPDLCIRAAVSGCTWRGVALGRRQPCPPAPKCHRRRRNPRGSTAGAGRWAAEASRAAWRGAQRTTSSRDPSAMFRAGWAREGAVCKSHQPSGRRWSREFSLLTPSRTLRGGAYPSSYPFPWTWTEGSAGRWGAHDGPRRIQ
eukprot:9504147-Pyramimonas_sp.AAC.1